MIECEWAGGDIHGEVIRSYKDFGYFLKEAIRVERRE